MKLAACQRYNPAEVPAGWSVEPIKQRIRFEYGSSLTDEARRDGPFPVFGSNGQVGTHHAYCVEGPGILVGRKGSVGQVHFSETPFWPIDTVYFVRRLQDDDWSYLYYLLVFLHFDLLNAATGVPGLTRRDAHDILGAFPGLEEQRRIAAALRLADDAIAKAQAELQAAQDLKRTLIAELVERGMPNRHPDFTITKHLKYPSDWRVTKLKHLGQWSAGGTPDRGNATYYHGSIPWVKSGEVNYNVITATEEHLNAEGVDTICCGILPIGTLLVAMYGAGVTRGRVALLGIPATTNQAVASFNGFAGVVNEFVFYWFQLNYQRIRSWAAGSNQDNLSGYMLKNMPIAIPPEDEQKEIVSVIKGFDALLIRKASVFDTLQTVKRSLLQHLLTGRIRLPEGAVESRQGAG